MINIGQYVYEVIEVTDYGKDNLDLNVGKILIKSSFYGHYHEMNVYVEKDHDIMKTGEMHYLFKIDADIKKQRKKAIHEMEDKLVKKRKFITRDIYEENKKKRAS